MGIGTEHSIKGICSIGRCEAIWDSVKKSPWRPYGTAFEEGGLVRGGSGGEERGVEGGFLTSSGKLDFAYNGGFVRFAHRTKSHPSRINDPH